MIGNRYVNIKRADIFAVLQVADPALLRVGTANFYLLDLHRLFFSSDRLRISACFLSRQMDIRMR
jgi:hypothetical protein